MEINIDTTQYSAKNLKYGYLWKDKFVDNGDQQNPLTLTPRNK